MSNHTPGPWEVSPKDKRRVNVEIGLLLHPFYPKIATTVDLEDFGDDCHDDWNICQCDGDLYMRSPEECEANSRLIAAAPDLLAVLKKAIHGGCIWKLGSDLVEADRIVEKAEKGE